MKPIHFFIATCFLASCNKDQQPSVPFDKHCTELPTAAYSREIEEEEYHYIQIVIENEKTHIIHEGKQAGTRTTIDDLHDALKLLYRKNSTLGHHSPLLVSAPASTKFEIIKNQIRTAASTGIFMILFEVASETDSDPRVVPLKLPATARSSQIIAPFFIQIASDGNINTGAGANRSQINGRDQNERLDKLSEQLAIYSAAARSAAEPHAPCYLGIPPEAPYQSFISVLSLINKYDLTPHFNGFAEEPNSNPIRIPPTKTSPPYPKETTPR